MTSKRLAKLARIRLFLSATAAFLVVLMLVSGVMRFAFSNVPASEQESKQSESPYAETTIPDNTIISETETAASAEVAEIPLEKVVTESMEEAVPTESQKEAVTEPMEEAVPTESHEESVAEPMEETLATESREESATEPVEEVSSTESQEDAVVEHIEEMIPIDVQEQVVTEPTEEDAFVQLPDENVSEPLAAETVPLEEESEREILESSSSDNVILEEKPEEVLITEDIEAPVETDAEYTLDEKNDAVTHTALLKKGELIWGILFWSSAGLLSVDLLLIFFVSHQMDKEKKSVKPVIIDPEVPNMLSVSHISTVHQVGRREYQQDSLGYSSILNDQGMLAVVADGMGGLTNGEKVSQQIVMDALTLGHQLHPEQVQGALWKMLNVINENVNRMLGPEGLYKSGSTIVAVLVHNGKFQWISVGDSRIYLYRQGYVNQLNQDHDLLQNLMADVLAGRYTMEEALRNPDSRKLTSFIGMGTLRYVDGSNRAIDLEAGDRLVLMSDGIYNIVNEQVLTEVLKRYPDVDKAAAVIDQMIQDRNHPHQDNYTAVILGV